MADPGLLADGEARRRALDPEASFIVEAPAGSGKTELLIQRYLVLLARVRRPESVLAVTFTRKAAAEMRARVLRALAATGGPEPGSEHELTTFRLASAVVAHDAASGWNLIANPSRLRIQTIDALAASIVGQMPWVSRMGAPPSPDDDVDDLYECAALRTLERVHPDGGRVASSVVRLLDHLDNNVGAAAGLLGSMLASRDQWLRHVATGALVSGRFREELDATLGEVVHAALRDLRMAFPDELRQETVALVRRAARRFDPRPPARAEGVGLARLAGLSDLPGVDDPEGWLALADLFLRKDGKRRTHLTCREGFPSGAVHAADKARFLALDPGVEFLGKLHAVRMMPPRQVGDRQWEVLSALGAILPIAAAELRVVFEDAGRVDFSEVALAAGEALGIPEAPTALAFAMDCRLEHILIDEFQDTSESQFELLTRLTDGWEPSDGRTLFVVGDPMQSIYRFRKAEVALFLRARRDGFGAIPLEPLTLRVNFRSSARVVDWVNRVIGPAFPSAEDLVTGAVTYRPSTAAQPGHDTRVGMRDVLRQVASADSPAPIGPVAVHAVGPRDDEAEARIVLDIIRRERAESPLSTLAVLVRSRSHADAISTALRSAGVRFQAVDMDPLGAAAVVRDLCMLTRALRHPADRIAWLAVLRAPWCGLTLTDLATLTRDAPDATIPDLIGDRERLGRLTANGRVRVGRVRGILDSALEKKGTLPLRRWVEGVWLELGGPAGIEDENASRDAEVFLDLLDRSDRGGDIEDMKRFEVRVSRLFARPDIGAETNTRGEAFVQLLTIHKAKGLEFDTVILPGLGRTTRSDPPRLIEWMEFVDPTGRPRLLAAPVREAGAGTDPLCRFIAGAASARSFHEDTRLLYVAATRARTRLHLVGHVDPDRKSGAPRPPDSRSALSRIWQTVGHEFAAAEREPAAPAAGALVGGSLLTRVPADWSPPAESTGVFRWSDPSGDRAPAEREPGPDPARGAGHDRPTFDWAGDLQRRAGIVVHAMLERMALSWEEAVGRGPDYDGVPIRAALGAEGLAGDRLAEAVGRVRTALERTVRDPRGRWILGPHSAAESEVRLTGQIDGVVRHIVIDRTFVEDGVRWIIDYKTGTHEGGGRDRFLDNEVVRYRPQMAQYAKTVRGFDSRPIRLGLYYPMLSGWREWSFEDNVDPGNVDGTHEALAVR